MQIQGTQTKDAILAKALNAKEHLAMSTESTLLKVSAIKVPFTENDIMHYWTYLAEIIESRLIKPVQENIANFQKNEDLASRVSALDAEPNHVNLKVSVSNLIAVKNDRLSIFFEN